MKELKDTQYRLVGAEPEEILPLGELGGGMDKGHSLASPSFISTWCHKLLTLDRVQIWGEGEDL